MPEAGAACAGEVLERVRSLTPGACSKIKRRREQLPRARRVPRSALNAREASYMYYAYRTFITVLEHGL